MMEKTLEALAYSEVPLLAASATQDMLLAMRQVRTQMVAPESLYAATVATKGRHLVVSRPCRPITLPVP